MNRVNILVVCVLSLVCGSLVAQELRVVCTVPDLADIVKTIGGERVKVSSFVRPRDNPHFISARPSFIRQVASADMFLLVGLDLEVGWAPALLRSARNNRVQPGQPGYVDCSEAITPLGVRTGTLDRSMGDVHPHGNPHYLLSPVGSIQVIDFVAARLAGLDPAGAEHYRQRAAAAMETLAEALYGEPLVAQHGTAQLVEWHVAGSLWDHIAPDAIGGWLAEMKDLRGAQLLGDHDQWPYFAACYGLEFIGFLEPKAGVPPTAGHKQQLVELIGQKSVRGLVTTPWFDPRHARQLAAATDIVLVPLAHQVGAVPGADSLIAMHASHVAALTTRLPQPADGTQTAP